MVQDADNVQPGEVQEGTEPKEEGLNEEQTQEKQPLTEEGVREILAQERERTERILGKFQSEKDVAVKRAREAERRASFAESFASGLETNAGDGDPDKAELTRLRAREVARQRADSEAQLVRNREKFETDFRDNSTQILTSMGVDPKDERIDWAEDAVSYSSGGQPYIDYLTKNKRILKSAAKILQENAKSEKEKMEQRFKDIESRISQEANSVETPVSGGAAISKKFAQIEQDYADGKISTAEYEKAMEKRREVG